MYVTNLNAKENCFFRKQPRYKTKFRLEANQIYQYNNHGKTKATDYSNYRYVKTIPISQTNSFVTAMFLKLCAAEDLQLCRKSF